MEEKISMRSKVRGLEVGESYEFPIIKRQTLANYASSLGYEGKKFSTYTDRARRVIRVTRIA